MAQLVKLAQRLDTIHSEYRMIMNDLEKINGKLKDLSAEIEKNPPTTVAEEDMYEEAFEKLKNLKEDLLNKRKVVEQKIKQLQHIERNKGQIQEKGRYEFFNLVGVVKIPVKNTDVYLKVFEVVNRSIEDPTAGFVSKYVLTLSKSGANANENYFESGKPHQSLMDIISHSEMLMPAQIPPKAESMIKDIHIDGGSLDGLNIRQFKGFNDNQKKSILTNLSTKLNQISTEFKQNVNKNIITV